MTVDTHLCYRHQLKQSTDTTGSIKRKAIMEDDQDVDVPDVPDANEALVEEDLDAK